MDQDAALKSNRRNFLSRIAAGAGIAGAAVIAPAPALAQVAATQEGRNAWGPAHHDQDDWLEIPSRHRFVLDATTPDGMGLALQFGLNYLTANRQAYGLQDRDLAILIVARHKATAFGFNDAMWEKYGGQFSQQSGFLDAKTGRPPAANFYLSGNESRMKDMVSRGGRFAVCQTATRAIILNVIKASGSDVDKILAELTANLIPNARLVSAGIVTVNRAQERGYSFAHAI